MVDHQQSMDSYGVEAPFCCRSFPLWRLCGSSFVTFVCCCGMLLRPFGDPVLVVPGSEQMSGLWSTQVGIYSIFFCVIGIFGEFNFTNTIYNIYNWIFHVTFIKWMSLSREVGQVGGRWTTSDFDFDPSSRVAIWKDLKGLGYPQISQTFQRKCGLNQ